MVMCTFPLYKGYLDETKTSSFEFLDAKPRLSSRVI